VDRFLNRNRLLPCLPFCPVTSSLGFGLGVAFSIGR
jgi:hypothetical protein